MRKQIQKDLNSIINELQFVLRPSLKKYIIKNTDYQLTQIMKYCIESKKSYDRALFVRLSNETLGGNWQKILGALKAVELMDFSVIVIDDILDESQRRMGRPTVYKKWGIKNAIIVSSILKSIASEELIRAGTENHLSSKKLSKILSIFERAHRTIYAGQYYDIIYEKFKINIMDSKKYLKMIKDTTGSQISACCAIGGILAKASDSEINALEDFGLYTGIIFQIRDDLIDYIGNEYIIGKPPYRDLLRQKKRLPLIIAYKIYGDRFLRMVNNKNRIYEKEIIEIIASQKVINPIRKIVRIYGNKALNRLKNLRDSNSVKYLKELLEVGMDI